MGQRDEHEGSHQLPLPLQRQPVTLSCQDTALQRLEDKEIRDIVIYVDILWLSALLPGPNDLSLFQPKCPETRDLSPRLFVYYHAKACRGGICTNLAPSSSADSQLVGHFTGQHYVTRDVKVAPLYSHHGWD